MLPLHVGLLRRHLFLFAIAACLSLASVADFKLELLTFGDVARVVAETIEELAFNRGFRPVLLLRVQLLELEALQVHLFKTFHARVLHHALEGALGDVGEASQRFYLEVTALNELVNVLLVILFELLFKCTIILRHL